MCEYCGCRGVPAIAELMDEHIALIDRGAEVRRALSAGNNTEAMSQLTQLVERLDQHVHREEAGIFRALRNEGEFVDEVQELEQEHRDFESTIRGLDVTSPDFAATVTTMLDDLEVHVEREDLGVFPVSVTTLGARGWKMIDEAHSAAPSFLLDSP